MRLRFTAILVLTLASLGAGLRAEDHSRSPRADASDVSRAVLNGKPSTLQQVLQIKITAPDGQYRCSSTVVGEDTLITAAHCVPPNSQISVNVNSATKGPESLQAMQCEANPGFPQTKPEDMKRLWAARKAAGDACEASRGKQDAASDAELARLEKGFLDLLQSTFMLSEEGMRSDVAVCKLASGKFAMPPAKVGKVEPGSKRYLFAGYGCTEYRNTGPHYPEPNELFEGTASLDADTSKGFISASYTKGNPESAGICSGDSGGALLQKTGEGVELVGVNSGGSNGGKFALDRSLCKIVQTGADSGRSVMVDLSSPTSQKFLSEMTAKGYKINGLGKALVTSHGPSNAMGDYPEIKLGVAHDPPRVGAVYRILSSLWEWTGTEWKPAKPGKR